MVDVTILGIALQGKDRTPFLIGLADKRHVISIELTPIEAVALSIAIHGPASTDSDKSALSLSHEFMLKTVSAFGNELVAVELLAFPKGLFNARAVFAQNGEQVIVGCRPADAVTLALLSKAPVRLVEGVTGLSFPDIDAVLGKLPAHIQMLAGVKMNEQVAHAEADIARSCAVIDAVVAQVAEKKSLAAHKKMLGLAETMFEKRSTPKCSNGGRDSLLRLGLDIGRTTQVLEPVTPLSNDMKRISDVLPLMSAIPFDVLASLGLSRKEAERDASESERWDMLLRILVPSTKVFM